MDFATTFQVKNGRQFLWSCLLLSIVFLQVGCAQLSDRASKTWSGFGSKEASALREERTPGYSSTGDLYAKSVGKGEGSDRSELVGETKANRSQQYAGAEVDADDDRDSSGGLPRNRPKNLDAESQMVVLQVPESLPASNEIESADTGTQPESVAEFKAQPRVETPVKDLMDQSYRKPSIESATDNGAISKRTLGDVLAESRAAIDKISTYQVSMNHQERVNGKLNPPENAVLSIRRQPKAVRIEWPEGANQGREVLYLADEKGGMMHVHMPNGLIPTLTMSPSSPLATRNSRHPISEAGLDTILSKMEDAYQARYIPGNTYGVISYLGMEKQPAGLDHDSEKIMRMTPDGEQWVVYIDSETNLPCKVEAKDARGELLERYFFTGPKVELPELSLAAAFDPDMRWGGSKGLFSRLARSAKEKKSEPR